MLTLERPIVFVDLESTGTAVELDRIVELAAVKLLPDGTRRTWCQRFNPGIPIPPEATAIHGITDDDVADMPTFRERASGIAAALADVDLGGHNFRRFDLRLLAAEFRRADVRWSHEGARIVDTGALFYRFHPRDLTAAVRLYVGSSQADEFATKAHGALADTLACLEVLQGQLAAHPELPHDLDGLHQVCLGEQRGPDAEGKLVWRHRAAALAFGKHAGCSLRQVAAQHPDYLEWILAGDFSDELKRIVQDALAGQFPAAPKDPP